MLLAFLTQLLRNEQLLESIQDTTILFSMLFISGTEGEDMVTTRVIIPRTHGKNFNSALFNICEVASRRLPLGNFSYVNVNPIQVLAVLEPVNMARLLLRKRHNS